MKLSPEDAALSGSFWTPSEELEVAVRTFGKYPNTQEWRPGDILLSATVKPNWIQRKIVDVQAESYGANHGQWQHAAIYMGNDYVSEATLRGIVYSPVSHYVGKHYLKLRRHPDLSADERWLTAIQAGVRIRQSYNFLDIWRVYARTFPGFRRRIQPSVLRQTEAVICSELCVQSYGFVKRVIVPTAIKPVLPASLSQTTELVDVPLYWRMIA